MEPCFIEGERGRLFAVYHSGNSDASQASDAILYLPPFAEENNRARHVAAAFARQCAATGTAVLLLDPYGTGDSDGEFGDADWKTWNQDIRRATGWLRKRGHARISLIGLRTGALLAAAACDDNTDRLILWAPVAKGELFLRQFLRQRVAADLTNPAPKSDTKSNAKPETVKDMLASLGQGEALEVAGYTLSPSMAEGLAESMLANSAPPPSVSVLWLDTAAEDANGLLPVPEECADEWREQGINVTSKRVAGPSFWQQIEPEPCPALIDATLDWLKPESSKRERNA